MTAEIRQVMKTPDFFNRSALTITLWRFRREFLTVGAFSMVANVLMLAPTLYMLQVYDRVLASQSELTLLALSLLTLMLFVVMAFAEWMRARVLVSTSVRLDEQLSTQVFNASFEAHLSQAGTSPSRAFGDLVQIRQFLTGNGVFAFFDAPWVPIYLAVLFFLHPWLGLLGVGFAMSQLAVAWLGHWRTLAPAEAASKFGAEASSFLQGKLRNTEVLESMGMVPNLQSRWAGRHQAHISQSAVVQKITQRLTASSKFIRYSQQSLSLGAGALLVIDGQLTAGGMIAASVMMTRALAPIDMIVGSWRQFIGTQFAFLRLEQVLLAYPQRDADLKRVVPVGGIELRRVFAFAAGRADPILKGISLQVSPGIVTAVLGPSGSGKSTLARVLLGIWPEVKGEVLLDGQAVASWSRLELGPHIGYLPQDIELFEGSIAENISRFGIVDSAQVIEAAQSAGLHETILRFPKGYDTAIGEAGNLLSGGQRQRIGLARAIYGNPQLIVLDEPNAHLDEAGELALNRMLAQLKAKGRTVFLISHRPTAWQVADRILTLRDGHVIADEAREPVLAEPNGLRTGANSPPQLSFATATQT